jgi:hypothetical protein
VDFSQKKMTALGFLAATDRPTGPLYLAVVALRCARGSKTEKAFAFGGAA